MFKKNKVALATRWGARFAGTWFILTGLIPLLDLHFLHMHTMMAALAIATGIAIMFDW